VEYEFLNGITLACERVFRFYHIHCISPDLDTLFNLLNAIHSLNDKLKKSKNVSFFDIDEFIALKALRNLFHHQDELINELRLIPVGKLPPISTDLLFLCLVPSELVQLSIDAIQKQYRDKEEHIIKSVLGWYGEVVNINPCIFNFMVKAYEHIIKLDINLKGSEFKDFDDTYKLETKNGHSHYVTGSISCHAGSIDEVLKVAYKSIRHEK